MSNADHQKYDFDIDLCDIDARLIVLSDEHFLRIEAGNIRIQGEECENGDNVRAFLKQFGDQLNIAVREFYSAYPRYQISFEHYPNEEALVGHEWVDLTLEEDVVVSVNAVEAEANFLEYDFAVLNGSDTTLCGRYVRMPDGW